MVSLNEIVHGSQAPLSDASHPELALAVEALRVKIAADHPGDTLAPIYIETSPLICSDEAGEGYELCGPNHNSAYRTPDPNSEIGERIIIGEGLIEELGIEQTVAIIAHEWGHDIRDHHLTTPAYFVKDKLETARAEECEADHFAAQYVDPGILADALKNRANAIEPPALDSPELWRAAKDAGYHSMAEYLENFRLHPLTSERIGMLEDINRVGAPAGTPFTDTCEISR